MLNLALGFISSFCMTLLIVRYASCYSEFSLDNDLRQRGRRNARTSVYLWQLCATVVVTVSLFWNDPLALSLTTLMFVLVRIYVAYRALQDSALAICPTITYSAALIRANMQAIGTESPSRPVSCSVTFALATFSSDRL